MSLRVTEADITTLALDAIVNAAQPALLGGGGVDGAIHRAAGPALLRACRALPEVEPGIRCPTGQARMTDGYALPARHVMHTVGPIWHGGQRGEADLLAGCYRQCLQLARDHGLRSVAFPAISCGVYGYPAAAAAQVAVRSIRQVLAEAPQLIIVLCAFDHGMVRILDQALQYAAIK